METAKNKPPRMITDTTQANCSACGEIIYTETHYAATGEDGSTTHSRVVSGSFRQATDASGDPAGPVIPFCPCKEDSPCTR